MPDRKTTYIMLGLVLLAGTIGGYMLGQFAWKDHDAWNAGYAAGCFAHVGTIAGGSHDCQRTHLFADAIGHGAYSCD